MKTAVREPIFFINRSQASSLSRGSLACKYPFQIRNAANILTGSPVRYFFARKSPAFCSRAGWLQRFVCKASRRGESPFKFHSLSGSCSNSARRLPRGRVTSQRTSASPSPWSRKRISCSSPTRIRSAGPALGQKSSGHIPVHASQIQNPSEAS